MEFAMDAAKRLWRNAASAWKRNLRRWALKTARKALDRADDWLHAREVAMRQEAARQEFLADVDPAASAVREAIYKCQNKRNLPACPPLGATASTSYLDDSTGAAPRLPAARMGRRRQIPKLRYRHGELVRSDANANL